MLGATAIFLWLISVVVSLPWDTQPLRSESIQVQLSPEPVFSGNMSSCPGYTIRNLIQTHFGFKARLGLAGHECNAFGVDIHDLTLEVTYETQSRLHVKIADSADHQYTIPESVIERPTPVSVSFKHNSDLVFNYETSHFAFWITRRSQPQATPLFDTRLASLPIIPSGSSEGRADNSTIVDGYPLVFEDQYLQVTSSLPLGANIYGLGEVVSSSGFRRNLDHNGGSIQAMWTRDAADPVDENVYGAHPVYLEHRFDEETGESRSHGVFVMNAAGADILLLTPPNAKSSIIQYRFIGGIMDYYFFSGPTPIDVIEQYGEVAGLPTWQPLWAFGFQLCRWGYHDLNETREQVTNMRKANIPLEVMWNDIDMYHAVRDFTTDPVTFPEVGLRAFISELAANHQKYIPIVDAAIPKQVNDTDIYDPYTRGSQLNVFIGNPDKSEYVGQVWPGYTVFPDWFQPNAQQWWTDALRNWSTIGGVNYSGIWLDMNEASSFCDGSCGTEADLSNTSVPFILPGDPGNPVLDYPECYDPNVWGPSGNMTINGTSTCQVVQQAVGNRAMKKRGLGAGTQTGVDLNTPPYAIHNGNGRLSLHALATNATHADGQVELDVHSLWGLMEARATYLALRDILPGKRPFVISRSTFASAGKWTGHWLGDNFSLWSYLRHSISGILQFQLFQVPFVGADTCGFYGNTDEELCNRWMQLSAFTPFYRNHNVKGAIPQEPYRWDSVAEASRATIAIRYSLLPYWYTLFANSSLRGTPPVRALFFEFPNEPELFAIDQQFLVGRDLLISPVLEPNVTTVEAILPGKGSVIWRDWYTHDVILPSQTANSSITSTRTILPAPVGHINVHIRDHSALLLYAQPSYTIEETRQSPFCLLVSLDAQDQAFGTAYLDDGDSYPPGPSRTLAFSAQARAVKITSVTNGGGYVVGQRLESITVLGVKVKPSTVFLSETLVSTWKWFARQEKLVVMEIQANLNEDISLHWT